MLGGQRVEAAREVEVKAEASFILRMSDNREGLGRDKRGRLL